MFNTFWGIWSGSVLYATCSYLFIPQHTLVVGYYGITLAVGVSILLSIHLSVICPSVFPFLDDNLSKHQWIFTKHGICIDIVEIWFGIANGQISSIFDSYLPETCPYFCFQMITWVKMNRFAPNLVCALILWRSSLGLLMGRFCQLDRVICLRHVWIFVSIWSLQ